MITERLQKSREFIEGECVKAASALMNTVTCSLSLAGTFDPIHD